MEDDEGIVCTPAEQTPDIKALADMSPSDLQSLTCNNLYTKKGRLSYVENYDRLYGEGKFWTEEDETEQAEKYKDEELAYYFIFMAFKKQHDKNSTLMSSMNEGNHRVQCVNNTAGATKVHQKVRRREASNPNKESLLTKEYLMKEGKAINENFLFVEGDTSVVSGIRAVMENDSNLMVRVNFSIPTRANDAVHPVGLDLIHHRNESMRFAREKHTSSDQSDFKPVAEEFKQVFQTSGQPASDELKKVYRKLCVNLKGKKMNYYVRPGNNKEEDDWAGTILRVVNRETIHTMRIKVGDEIVSYPFRPENLRQLIMRTRTRKPDPDREKFNREVDCFRDDLEVDIVEITLFHFGTILFQYCMKRHGGAADDEIRETCKMILAQRLYNLSRKRRHDTKFLPKLGDDKHKGVAVAIYLQSMYVTGALYKREREVITCIGNLGIASRDQEQHYNFLSKYFDARL